MSDKKPSTKNAGTVVLSPRERAEAVQRGLDALLAEFNCRLVVSMTLRAGAVIPHLDIEPNEAEQERNNAD